MIACKRMAPDIVLLVQQRLFYRSQHHGDGLMAIENRAQAGYLGNPALLERPPLHRPAIAAGQVVIGYGFKIPLRERFASMA